MFINDGPNFKIQYMTIVFSVPRDIIHSEKQKDKFQKTCGPELCSAVYQRCLPYIKFTRRQDKIFNVRFEMELDQITQE